MPGNPKIHSFSLQAQKAKLSTITTIRNEIVKGVIDNWYKLPATSDQELTSENIEREVKRLMNPPPDTKGQKPKYVRMPDGRLVPTEETLEEYGNVSARSIDKATHIMGMSWLNTLVTGVKAFFALITGKAKSFTEAYAQITTQDISTAYSEEMAALGHDHQEFIDTNKLLERGQKKIAQAVRVEAKLEEAPATETFNIDTHPRPSAPPVTKHETKAGEKPEDGVKRHIDTAIKATKIALLGTDETKYPKPDSKQGKQLAALEQALHKHALLIARAPDAPTHPAAFSERLIKATCKECGITIPDKPLSEVIETLSRSANPEELTQAALLRRLDVELKGTHGPIRQVVTGKEPTAEEKLAAEQAAKKERLASNQKTIKSVTNKVHDTAYGAVIFGVKRTAAEAVAKTSDTWWPSGFAASSAIGNGRRLLKDYIGYAPPTDSTEKKEWEAAIDVAYDFTVSHRRIFNEDQLKHIAKVIGQETAKVIEATASLKLSQTALADKLQEAVSKRLEAETAEINRLGENKYTVSRFFGWGSKEVDESITIAGINKELGSGRDILAELAENVGQTIRANTKDTSTAKGLYDILAEAQASLSRLQAENLSLSAAMPAKPPSLRPGDKPSPAPPPPSRESASVRP